MYIDLEKPNICPGCKNEFKICKCKEILDGYSTYIFPSIDTTTKYIKVSDVIEIIAGWRDAMVIIGSKHLEPNLGQSQDTLFEES